MSALGGAGSAAAVSSVRTDPSENDFGSLSNSEFFEIIMTELSAQDPLAPNDTKALIEQISLIRGIESDENITDSLDNLSDQSEFNSAAGLIGTLVSGVSEDGRRILDVVTSVSRTSDGPVLNFVDGTRVKVSNVDEVREQIDLSDLLDDDEPDDDGGAP